MLTPSKVASRVWKMFDGLAADTLWSGAADLVMMINAYVSVQILQETLAKETIGNYFGLFGVIGVLGAFVYSGVGMAALQRVLGDRVSPNQVLSSYWSWSVLLAGGAIVVVLLAGGLRLKNLSILEISLLALSELIVVAMIAVIASVSQGAVGFPSAARLRLGVTLIRLATTVSLFLLGQFTIRNLGLGFLVGFSIYAAWVVYRYLPKHGLYLQWERPTRIVVNGSLTFSSPMAAGKVQTDGDKYLLNSFGFETQAASYGLAYRGMQVANAPLLALESAAFQRFLPKGDGQKGLHMRRANRFTLLMFGAGVVVAGIMFLALPLLKFLLFRGDTTDAGDILPFLLPLIPVMALSGTPLNGLIGLGRAKERGYLFAISAAISVALYLPLISRFDWKGALVATYLSEFVLIVLGWYALWHFQRIEDNEIDKAALKKADENKPEQVDL